MVSPRGNRLGKMLCRQGLFATATASGRLHDYYHPHFTENIVRGGLNYQFH